LGKLLGYFPGVTFLAECSWRPEHIKVFAAADAAETRFEENEGAAFEYEVLNEPDWPVFPN
jgi:hypothetical protein